VPAPGPWLANVLCRELPPGTKPSAFASYCPVTRPMSSDMMLRWNHGGRKVFSPTSQRGAKITKSQLARPGVSVGLVGTVKIDGSGWSWLVEPITLKLAVSYFDAAR